jgi:hypothetical protein
MANFAKRAFGEEVEAKQQLFKLAYASGQQDIVVGSVVLESHISALPDIGTAALRMGISLPFAGLACHVASSTRLSARFGSRVPSSGFFVMRAAAIMFAIPGIEKRIAKRCSPPSDKRQTPGKPDALVHHSEQGGQFTFDQFRSLMADKCVTCSMSHPGNVWDNTAIESIFPSLKTERTARTVYRLRNQACADIFDYIERRYDAKRRHSTIRHLISSIEIQRREDVS